MVNSNSRKLTLSGWLKEHNSESYNTPLKLQKFLFFYESFTKVAKEQPDFRRLRGYKNGPVFSDVWGDYTKERISFDKAVKEAYQKNSENINEKRAEKCSFIVRTLTEKELSDLTHEMNLWSSKEKLINEEGAYQVDLNESDFTSEDIRFINTLDSMYPTEIVENSTVITLGEKNFVFSNSDYEQLPKNYHDILSELSKNQDIYNPVFVELDEEGRFIID